MKNGVAHAVPSSLTEQGRLFDEDGEPVNGPVLITFTLYSDAEGCVPVQSDFPPPQGR